MLSETKRNSHRTTSRQAPLSTARHGRNGKLGAMLSEQEAEHKVQEDTSSSDTPSITPTQAPKVNAEGATPGATSVKEADDTCPTAALREVLEDDGVGLQDGDQNSVNESPQSVMQCTRSTVQDNANQLITPSTSPTSKSESQLDGQMDEETLPHEPSLTSKTKRRLNLHSGSYSNQPPQKKRKAPPKRQSAVQTTLSLNVGAGAGMKECKVCDTVYNPFHAEDVKVHAKRHAIVLRNKVKA